MTEPVADETTEPIAATGGAEPQPPTEQSDRRHRLVEVAGIARALALPAILGLMTVLAVGTIDHTSGLVWLLVVVLSFVPITALAVFALLARRSVRVERAVRPVEAGLLVGLVVSLAVAIFGGIPFSDAFAAGAVVAAGTTIVAGISRPLVEGRRRARTVSLAFLVVALGAGGWVTALFTGAFDDYVDMFYAVDAATAQREVLRRVDAGGVLLGTPGLATPGIPLRSGYADATVWFQQGPYPVDPVTGAAMATTIAPADPVASAAPTPAGIATTDPAAAVPAPVDTTTNVGAWATLRARPDDRLELAVDRSIAAGIAGAVSVQVFRGSCAGASGRRVLASWRLEPGARSGEERRSLSLRARDLRIDDQLAVVAGADRPLAPTRCADLLGRAGIALASLGAARFHDECVAPLELSASDEQLLASSSFADAGCARRLEQLAGVVAGGIVPDARVGGVRDCLRGTGVTPAPREVAVPGGVAFLPSATPGVDDPFGACVSPWQDTIAWPVQVVDPGMAVPAGAIPASAIDAEYDGQDPAELVDKLR